MMKKIFALVLLLVLGKLSYAQYPITQTLGSDSTIVISKGALQSRLINVTYTDTTAANLQRIRQYPGAQIATTTGGLNLWVRNANATAWIPVATGSGNNIYTIDGTLLGNRTLTGAGYSLTFNQLSKLLFNADSTTINTDQATISNNGVSTLSVKGATGRMFLVDTTAPADERIYELKSSNGEFFISILNDAQTSNDSAFLITSASRVGINTLNPDSTLKVGGGVNILGGLRVGNLPTSPGTKQLRINAQGQFSVTDTLIDAGGTVTSIATNNGSGITGGTITTTGTLAIDTTNVIATKASVSGGLAGKLNISDTAAMLAPYLRAIDTASLSNRINLKVNISDTATMLGNYLNNVGYGLSKAGQVASADSATLSAYYLRRKDSLTVTNPLGYVTQKILADTAAAIRSSDLGGTVTSVATNDGTGITGGTITTSGTLAIDTTVISTRAWRQKGVDSVAALANTKISGSLISGYLTKATGSLTIDTSQLYQSSGLIGIGTTSPTQKLQVSGNAYVNGQLFAGDTALSTYQVEGILSTPYVLGRKAVDNTISTEARPTGIQGHVVGRGSIANRLQGGTFYATTDSASTANSTGSLRGMTAWSSHNGSGSITTAWGGYNIVQNKTTGTITNAYGSVSGVENRGATSTINKLHGTTTEVWNNYGGTIDTAFGQVISIYNNNAASNIGAVYGLSIGKGLISASGGTHYWRNSGTIGTSYGFYLDSSIDVGTTKYALFSNSNSNSYFRAKLGVGTTSPDSAFQVATGAYFQRGIRASGLPQAPGTKALRIDASGTISYADTLIDAGGTVTSVATNNGTGITGGTITTTGTLAIDTLLISTRAWRQKGVDSLQANINLKLNISDTASMLANYITGPQTFSGYMARFNGGGTIDTSRIFQNNGLVGINTTSPSYSLDVLGTARVTSNSYLATSSGVVGIGTTSADSLLTVEQGAWVKRGLRLSGLPTGTGTKELRIDANGVVYANDTLSNDISGSGTTNYIPKFTSSSAIGNSLMQEVFSGISFGGPIYAQDGTSTSASIRFYNSNSGLYYPGSDGLGFITNATEKMRLTSGGSLGIGTSSPNTYSGYTALTINNSSTGALLDLDVADVRTATIATTVSEFTLGSITNIPIAFITNSSERMRLDASGNLGINNSSPAAKLDVQGSSSDQIRLRTAATEYYGIGRNSSTGYLDFYGSQSGYVGYLFGGVNGTRMTLDASGNLGLGVSPSAWLSTNRAFQLGYGSLRSFTNSANTYLENNNYVNTSGTDIYLNNGAAGRYRIADEQHIWYQAPSGTAGNAISFTQAMTLDASGRLGIGTSSPASKLDVNGDITMNGSMTIKSSGTTRGYFGDVDGNGNIQIRAENALTIKTGGNNLRATLDASGNLGLGVTPSAWGSSNKVYETTFATSMFGRSDFSGLGRNFYYNSSDAAIYANNGHATFYAQASGQHQWFYAASGTAGNAISFTQAMTLDASGRLGIGTTSPGALLEVTGSYADNAVRIQNTNTSNFSSIAYINSSGTLKMVVGTGNSSSGAPYANNGYIYTATSTDFIFAIGTSERMRITSSGNVGIGTTSPLSRLHVEGTMRTVLASGVGGQTLISAISGVSNGYLINVDASNNITHTWHTGANSPSLYIGSSGNVGIGTTSPTSKFDVYTGTGASFRVAYSTTNQIEVSNYNATDGYREMAFVGSPLSFYTATAGGTSGSERMRITSAGNVGIGTTSPDYKFQVSDGTIKGSFNPNSTLSGMFLGANSNHNLIFGTNDSERMRITSGGELLINTTTDAGAYYLQVNGDVYAGAYYESSDRRLKDILSVRGGSDGINTVTFKWKDQRDSLSHIGYIAQEVEKVLPDAVKTNPNGYKTINYDEVQSLKIANLEQEIAELKKVIKQLIDKK